MNFKPTVAKVLTSIILGLLSGYLSIKYGFLQEKCLDPYTGTGYSLFCDNSYLSIWPSIIIFFVSILVVYTIWSLATKK